MREGALSLLLSGRCEPYRCSCSVMHSSNAFAVFGVSLSGSLLLHNDNVIVQAPPRPRVPVVSKFGMCASARLNRT